jgi:hypothetical protein
VQIIDAADDGPVVVRAGDWLRVTVLFTKLSMHVTVRAPRRCLQRG